MSKRLGKLVELKTLYDACRAAEVTLNDTIFKSLATKHPSIFNTKFTTHGYYIKHLITGFDGVSNYEEVAGTGALDELGRQILLDLSHNTQTLIDLGVASIYADLKKNVKKPETVQFAFGNVDELKSFKSLKTMLDKYFPGASITDTAPKDFGQSVKYDMQIAFPLDFTKDVGVFHINIENKSGVTNDASTSSFHFGSISNKAITGGDLSYVTFLDRIQEISRKYLTGHTFGDCALAVRQAKDQYLHDLAVEYIKWRLENNWPVFTSSKKDSVILCSEVVKQMMSKDMTYFGDESEDPGDQVLKYYDSTKWAEGYTEYRDKNFYNLRRTGIDSVYRSLKTQPEAASSINKLIEQGKRISPHFKISLWYGKK